MNANIHSISCFPNISDKFLTWGSEINLYEFKSSTTPLSSPIKPQISDQLKILHIQNRSHNRYDNITTVSANLLTREDRYEYIRCIKPSFYEKPLIAVGLSSGKVGICDFEINKSNITADEFIPRQQRSCLCLAWNEVDKNILAIGHDKNRSDYCISIFDINRPQSSKDVSNGIGLSDTAHSMCWDKSNRALIAGINQKTIRIYDLRSTNFQTPSSTVNTRFVNGLTLSQNGDFLATYVDSLIGIWDLRNLDKTLTQIQTTIKNISQISWCGTRTNIISAMSRGAPHLQVFDVYPVDIENGNELYYTKQSFLPGSIKYGASSVHSSQHNKAKSLAGFSWHPSHIDHALILLEDGTIEDFFVPHRISISIDSKNNIWQSFPPKNSNTKFEIKDLNNDKNCVEDISKTMRDRAIKRYGLLPDRGKNGETTNNPTLKAVWSTLEKITVDDTPMGLKNILGIDSNQAGENVFTNRSETLNSSWPELIKKSSNFLTYRNSARTQAQHLCGWDFDTDATLVNKFLPELCAKKEHTRAAMIAIFFLKTAYACDILLKATDQTNSDPSMLRMAAIALSSFESDCSNNTWRQQQAIASTQIRDPHLRTIFSFLTIENENFDVILNEKGISLADRVAFACKFLNDIKLVEYIKNLIQKCIQEGDLNGLLLTGGECPETINLMQAYVDRSEDVQTVSLLAIEYFHVDEITDYRIQFWISSYLELLDIWGLWEKRAELEIKMNKNQPPSGKSSRSVFLLCSFCGKSVSSALTDDARLRNVSSHVNKLSSCPSCRKPLPRCSLCLLHMGTTTAILSQNLLENESLGWQSKPFSKWFSWCQSCRHGGHTEHLTEWFQKNSECPVTGCSCKCFDMDLPVPKFPDED